MTAKTIGGKNYLDLNACTLGSKVERFRSLSGQSKLVCEWIIALWKQLP